MPDKTTSVAVTRIAAPQDDRAEDVVAIEEPLEIRAAWTAGGEPREKNISVTMRTPGDDFDLAVGFLFTEGLLQGGGDVESVRHWGSPNIVRVALAPHARIDTSKLDRHFYTTSSCGVCGKTSIEALRVVTAPLPPRDPIDRAVIHRLPAQLHEAQPAFRATGSGPGPGPPRPPPRPRGARPPSRPPGGGRGAAIFARAGTLRRVREDVGRHNAVDKAI